MRSFSIKHKKTILVVFIVAVAVVCVSKVLLEYQWQQIFESLREANLRVFLAGSVVSIIAYWLLRAARWHILLRSEHASLPFRQIYLVTAVSVGASTVTPFQSGEALKVEYLKRYGGARLSGYAVFFLERLFDLLTVVGLGILGVSFGFDFGISPLYLFALGAFLIVGFLTLVGIVFRFRSERLDPVRNLAREQWKRKRALAAAACLTVFSWAAVVLGWKIALTSVSINVDFWQASTIVSFTTLLVILSFVPGAVGVSEVSISTILAKMGVESASAQTGAIAVRGYTLVIIALTLLHWIIFKILSKRNFQE